tara:strand:- start:125914 stop:126312 length:399 start_codon:yes stop_codon:yes gene_type:complete
MRRFDRYVECGNYQPFEIDAKGLTLLGEPGVSVLPGLVEFRIKNTTPSQTVTIPDMAVEAGRILCFDCAGLILLDDLQTGLRTELTTRDPEGVWAVTSAMRMAATASSGVRRMWFSRPQNWRWRRWSRAWSK